MMCLRSWRSYRRRAPWQVSTMRVSRSTPSTRTAAGRWRWSCTPTPNSACSGALGGWKLDADLGFEDHRGIGALAKRRLDRRDSARRRGLHEKHPHVVDRHGSIEAQHLIAEPDFHTL